ncbi:MAG: anthranilate synthase component I family protein [Bacteroidales bacterium]|jgi:anthranilate synthase component 1|nr:anthranilate synthase component I family protein [Bacteroidales bacterium]
MQKIKVQASFKKILADTITPVSTYLKIRDQFTNSLLLESSDYHSKENSYSYVCLNPVAGFITNDKQITKSIGGQTQYFHSSDLISELKNFTESFEVNNLELPFIYEAVFGYMTYDSVQYFEDIKFSSEVPEYKKIPNLQYHFYRFILVFDHFKNELYIIQNDSADFENTSLTLESIELMINNRNFSNFPFQKTGEEESNLADEEYKALVAKGKEHCQRGDVFQIVLSREFRQKFQGDEFNVYRALRATNPSPYLFYFDYGSYRIFGSSPEAQLTVRDGIAGIHPIAGTYRRTGNKQKDEELAAKLQKDTKENAEHVMLVDLARNDLSRNSREVTVETFGEIQYFSHVIHMVSKVTGKIDGSNAIQLAADTFPAGTLSGAPKHRAMQLIDKYEPNGRSFYGGAVGFIGINGEFNHAIIIRSFLSKNNQLIYQAGAGIVIDSSEEGELNEVNNKIAAVRMAIEKAEMI